MNELPLHADKIHSERMSAVFIESDQEEELFDPFTNLQKTTTNLYNEQYYEDDHFKLLEPKTNKVILKKRLRDIFSIGTSIKDCYYTSPKHSS